MQGLLLQALAPRLPPDVASQGDKLAQLLAGASPLPAPGPASAQQVLPEADPRTAPVGEAVQKERIRLQACAAAKPSGTHACSPVRCC